MGAVVMEDECFGRNGGGRGRPTLGEFVEPTEPRPPVTLRRATRPVRVVRAHDQPHRGHRRHPRRRGPCAARDHCQHPPSSFVHRRSDSLLRSLRAGVSFAPSMPMLPERARRRGDHLRFALAMIATEGCAATFARGRARVRDVDLRGVRAVPADELRAGIATQETSQRPAQRPRFLRWWRWWWVTPSYLDAAAANRHPLRTDRLHASRRPPHAPVPAHQGVRGAARTRPHAETGDA